jgi:hypothetical protein
MCTSARSLDEIPVDLWAALSHSTAELGVHKNFDIFLRELADHPLFIEKCVNYIPSFQINYKMSVTAVAFKIDGSRRRMNQGINERTECEENFPFAVLRPCLVIKTFEASYERAERVSNFSRFPGIQTFIVGLVANIPTRQSKLEP